MHPLLEILKEFGLPIVIIFAMGIFIYKIWQKSKEHEDRLLTTNEKAIETICICTDRLTTVESDLKEIKTDVKVIKEIQHEQRKSY